MPTMPTITPHSPTYVRVAVMLAQAVRHAGADLPDRGFPVVIDTQDGPWAPTATEWTRTCDLVDHLLSDSAATGRPVVAHGHTLALAPAQDVVPLLDALTFQATTQDVVAVRAVPGDDRSGPALAALLESRRTARPLPDPVPSQVWVYVLHADDLADPVVAAAFTEILAHGGDHGVHALVGSATLPTDLDLDAFTCRVAWAQEDKVLGELFGPSARTPDSWGTVQAQHTPDCPVVDVDDIRPSATGPLFHPRPRPGR